MSIFLFHRDLRIGDNTSLNKLREQSTKPIIPIFVFTPEQITNKNPYKSDASVQFMIESLIELKKQTQNKLLFFYGDLIKVLEDIFKNNTIQFLGFNLDYSPYAITRTQKVLELCKKYQVTTITEEDYTLIPMNQIRDGKHFAVFRAFYNKIVSKKIPSPIYKKIHFQSTLKKTKYLIHPNKILSFFKFNSDIIQHGGRQNGLKQLNLLSYQKKYDKTRNIPTIPTSLLSAHIKYGTVSIRETYFHMKKINTELLRQLIWHDFYAQLLYFLPVKNTLGGGNYKNKTIKWLKKEKWVNAWKNGLTGFPIIDAGMRQLNTIGWIHNRIRLLVSNFLTLVLLQNWKIGEQYFAQKLVDYDPSSNNLNWQFSAQVGTDRVPYLRIYNPFTQSKEIDLDCEYIKKWIPELRNIDNKIIHSWDKYHENVKTTYPEPIINFKEQTSLAKQIFRN